MCKFLYKQGVIILVIILFIFFPLIGSISAPNSSYASSILPGCEPTVLKPDLVVNKIEIITENGSYVRVTVKNSGEEYAASILVYIVLSEHTDLQNYHLVYEYTIDYLNVNEKDITEVSIDDLYLNYVPVGEYYAGAIVDPLEEIDESNEENNTNHSVEKIVISEFGNISIGIE